MNNNRGTHRITRSTTTRHRSRIKTQGLILNRGLRGNGMNLNALVNLTNLRNTSTRLMIYKFRTLLSKRLMRQTGINIHGSSNLNTTNDNTRRQSHLLRRGHTGVRLMKTYNISVSNGHRGLQSFQPNIVNNLIKNLIIRYTLGSITLNGRVLRVTLITIFGNTTMNTRQFSRVISLRNRHVNIISRRLKPRLQVRIHCTNRITMTTNQGTIIGLDNQTLGVNI